MTTRAAAITGVGYTALERRSGRTVLELAHEWARDAGHRSIGLHVFAGNRGAIALYESLGYETTDVSMRRSLG